jgi:hypothetical protein
MRAYNALCFFKTDHRAAEKIPPARKQKSAFDNLRMDSSRQTKFKADPCLRLALGLTLLFSGDPCAVFLMRSRCRF